MIGKEADRRRQFAVCLAEALAEAGISLLPAMEEQFSVYYELLARENEVCNLIGTTDPGLIARKHIVDCLLCYDQQVFAGAGDLADVGSGAGFPGLVLKIFCPELNVVLVESVAKKAGFLTRAVAALGLSGIEVWAERAELVAHGPAREKFAIVCSRAVAAMPVLCELCLPLVRVGGWFMALKGPRWQDEVAWAAFALAELGGEVAKVKQARLPGEAAERITVYTKKTRSTPAKYPRRPGMPEKRPLGWKPLGRKDENCAE